MRWFRPINDSISFFAWSSLTFRCPLSTLLSLAPIISVLLICLLFSFFVLNLYQLIFSAMNEGVLKILLYGLALLDSLITLLTGKGLLMSVKMTFISSFISLGSQFLNWVLTKKTALSLFGWNWLWLLLSGWGVRQQVLSPSHQNIQIMPSIVRRLDTTVNMFSLWANLWSNPLSSRIWEVLFKLIQCISGLVSALNTVKSYFSCHIFQCLCVTN